MEGRRQIAGVAAIEAALEAGEPVRLVLLAPGAGRTTRALAERALATGARVREESARMLRRLSRAPEAEVLALIGADSAGGLSAVLAARGAAWLLVGVAYGSNAGFAIRTAEVAGASGVIIDASFGGAARREALRASIRADRFFPVCWERALPTIERAAAEEHRVIAIEDVGTRAPWEVDLTGPVLFVVGGEKKGVPAEVLARADAVVRIPMRGFIPSYNLQAAVAAVAVERLRQVGAARPSGRRDERFSGSS